MDWAEQLLAKGLSQKCLASTEHKTILPESIAFLARSRINLQQLLEALDRRKIEYHFAAGEAGLFDSDEYRAILYGIKVLACPGDLAISRSLIACLRSITPENSSLPDASMVLGEQLLREIRDSLANSVLRQPFAALNAAARTEANIQSTVAELTSWSIESDQPRADVVDLRLADRELLKMRWDSFRALMPPDRLTWKAFLS